MCVQWNNEDEKRSRTGTSRIICLIAGGSGSAGVSYYILVWKVEQHIKCAAEVTDFSGLNATDTMVINNNNNII